MYKNKFIVALLTLTLGLQTSIAQGRANAKVAKPSPTLHKEDSTTAEQQLRAKGYFYRGTVEASAERYDEAFALLRHSYALDPTNPAIAHALGKLYGQRGNYDETIRLLRAAYEGDKDEQEYMLALASAYLWGNSAEEAQAVLEEWLGRNPADEIVLQQLGKMYFRSGAYDKALALYDQLLTTESQYHRYAQITNIKATLLEARGQKKRALEAWQTLLAKFPDVEEAVLAYAEWCLRSDQVDLGQKALTAYGARSSSANLKELLVRYAIAQKDYPRAERLLTELLDDTESETDDLLVLWYQLLVEQRTGDTLSERYNDKFERIIKQHPDHTNAYLTYGQVLRLQKRYEEAIKVVRPLVRSVPENTEVWNSLIGDAISLGDNALVMELCLEAIKHVRSDWRYYFYASVGLFSEGKKLSAKQIVTEALTELPEDDKEGRGYLYGHLGDLESELGDTIQAFRHYETALELYPDNPSVLNNYAYALAKRDEQLDKAERMAAQAVKLQGNDANLLDTYAWVFYKRGKYSLAQLYQRKAIDASEDDPSAVMYDHLGDIQLAMDETEAALASWQRAEELSLAEMKQSEGEALEKARRRLTELRKKIKKHAKK